MTLAKASVLAAVLVGAVALAIAYGPTLSNKWEARDSNQATAVETEKAPAPAPAPARKTQRTARARTESAPMAESTPIAMRRGEVRSVQPTMWEPDLQKRAKDVLNPGAKLELAAADFQSVEQFMTVAHAAKNTGVPFMVLKDRVVNQKTTLADAIHELKPDVDAKSEVARARVAAEQDLGAE